MAVILGLILKIKKAGAKLVYCVLTETKSLLVISDINKPAKTIRIYFFTRFHILSKNPLSLGNREALTQFGRIQIIAIPK